MNVLNIEKDKSSQIYERVQVQKKLKRDIEDMSSKISKDVQEKSEKF